MAEYTATKATALKVCELCKLKGKHYIATAFNVQCQDYFCSRSSEYHSLSKSSKHHRILEHNDMPSRKASSSISEYCNKHGGESFFCFCQTHNRLVCHICKQSLHVNCKDVIPLSELTNTIENSEMYREFRMEIRQIILLLRRQKTQILKKFQKASDSVVITCEKEKSSDNKIGSEMENLVNDQTEHRNEQYGRTTKIILALKSCDDYIQQAEMIEDDLELLELTKQQTQLFVAINSCQQQIKIIKAASRKITYEIDRSQKQTGQETDRSQKPPHIVNLCTVRTKHLEPFATKLNPPKKYPNFVDIRIVLIIFTLLICYIFRPFFTQN